MQRIIPPNWQQSLVNTILRGQFMISPDVAIGLGPQIQDLLTKGTIYTTDILKLEEIDIRAYNENGDSIEASSEVPQEEKRVVVLPIHGTMLKYGTLCTYGMAEIAYYIKHYAAQDDVQGIVLDIDSGGGATSSIPPILEAIEYVQALSKPIVAHCDVACSAAYWAASATDRIFAGNDISSLFGSIGVMISFIDVIPYYEKLGAKYHEVYADQSDQKNLDFQKLRNGEYDKIKKEFLNPMAIKFQDAVKSNRDGEIKLDSKGILNGATYSAQDSLDNGLIDAIGNLNQAINYVQVNAWASSNN